MVFLLTLTKRCLNTTRAVAAVGNQFKYVSSCFCRSWSPKHSVLFRYPPTCDHRNVIVKVRKHCRHLLPGQIQWTVNGLWKYLKNHRWVSLHEKPQNVEQRPAHSCQKTCHGEPTAGLHWPSSIWLSGCAAGSRDRREEPLKRREGVSRQVWWMSPWLTMWGGRCPEAQAPT